MRNYCISHPVTTTVMLNLYGGGTGLEGGSDVASPPLWKTSSQTKVSTMHSRVYNHHRHRVVSSTRSQEIAKDREKLMELIQNMPGDLFELSLRDMVEKPIVQGVDQATVIDERKEKLDHEIQKKLRNKIRNEQKKGLLRSGSMNDEHVVLKTFFPSFGIKKSPKPRPCLNVSAKHIRFEGNNDVDESPCWKKQATKMSLQLLPCLDVSTRHCLLKGEKGVETRSWRKPVFFVGQRSRKMVINSSRTGSSDRAVTDFSPGCWFFTNKGKVLNRTDPVARVG